ncbi:hypothetical protein FAF44_37355 [Nonomuraea sp. MG754425]|uniref:hypothetical protein n=1 Tax=Nonomuraea sp. MG754425 TaxID=2570319 RepID=UPI001F30D155|nr:hypothetical protein [Nonomuraea sp. MG754425]MCF6474013.1 hypothetical protein [Nonomuraea sp. MG754425]
MAYPQQPHPHGAGTPQGPQGYGPPPGRGTPGYGPPQAPEQQEHGQPGQQGHQPPPGYGPPPGGQDGAGQGQYGQNQYGHNQYGQNQYGQSGAQQGQGPGQYGQSGAHYGPGPGQYGQAGQPPYGQPPGQYGYGHQPGPPPYGPAPGNSTNRVLIGVVAVLAALLLLGGGAFGAYALLGSPGPAPTGIAQPTTSLPAPPSSAPPTSAPPSSEPPTATGTPEPTDPPSTSTNRSDEPLAHSEFGDWNFSLKGEKYAARKVGGWTYDSCDPLDAEGVLADNDCESAVQLAYTAYGGNLKAVQIIASFPKTGDAKATANALKNSADTKVAWRRSSAHSRYAYGAIYTGSYLNYLVVTVVTANRSAQPKAKKFHTAMQSDRGVYLFLGRQKERVVTS